MRSLILAILLLLPGITSGEVRIRLFTVQKPETVIFSVENGSYRLFSFTGDSIDINTATPVIISKYKGKLAVKVRNRPGYLADSVIFSGKPGNTFSLATDAGARRIYTGALKCLADLNTILMINLCNEEPYVAGVVRAEGGTGKNIEYFKTQSVLARTYLYKYINRHAVDGYDLCDDIHCQAYQGICTDDIINTATLSTAGKVILDRDSVLIISAFHSNCGGETASAGDVWLTEVPYLKKVTDPFCTSSRNASWQASYAADEWLNMIKRISHTTAELKPGESRFSQPGRVTNYRAGTVTVPLTGIRSALNLRSTFFSVIPEGDRVILRGKGYGHGVGLCQEGAMMMASKGFNYKQIIEFYYTGVIIADRRPPSLPSPGGEGAVEFPAWRDQKGGLN